jgi:hypothetical protein
VSPRFGSLLVAGALAVAVAVPARANHIPGATYTGSAATGGTVELVVSADGAAVTRFEAADVPTNCGAVSVTVTRNLPIVEHAFLRPPADGAAFSGTFGATQQVAGTLSEAGECAYSVPWSATTSAAPPPAPAADVTPPTFDARAGRRLRRGGVVLVGVRRASEDCRVTVAGSLSVPGRARAFRLRGASAQLPGGGSVGLRLTLGRRGRAAARRALANGRRVRARTRVTAVDAAGNRTVTRLASRLQAAAPRAAAGSGAARPRRTPAGRSAGSGRMTSRRSASTASP